MNKSIGWGILATGRIAELFTRDLITAGLNVIAVGSRTEEKARVFPGSSAYPRLMPVTRTWSKIQM